MLSHQYVHIWSELKFMNEFKRELTSYFENVEIPMLPENQIFHRVCKLQILVLIYLIYLHSNLLIHQFVFVVYMTKCKQQIRT